MPGSALRQRIETFVRELHTALAELGSALAQPHTYDFARNAHAWLGLILALPIPFLALALDLAARGAPVESSELLRALATRPVHVVFFAVPFITSALAGALGTIREHDERRIHALKRELAKSRRETRRACARLGRLDETKRRLVAAVSHELRTPLTAIYGYADILRRGRLGHLTDRQSKAIEVLLRAVERERATVENLLAYSRLETASYRLERELLDLREPVLAAHDAHVEEARRRGVSLEIDLPEDPVPVDADASGLLLVASNLLANAVKMTPPGGRAVIGVETRNARARVTVVDTGPGVPPDIAKKVFEPFFQAVTGDTREKGGAGLGLSIVKGVLDAHGTSVSLDEPPGGGARFTFSLPLATAPLPAPRSRAA